MKKIKEYIKRNWLKNVIALVLTIITEIISIKFIRPHAFTGVILSKFSYWFINITFVITLFVVYRVIIYFIKKMKQKDKFYFKILKYSLIYLGFMIVFLLLIYPGVWLYDEFWVLDYATDYLLNSWQSYISVMLYTFSLYIIPNPIGIVIFQIITISLIFGYMQTRINFHFNKKRYNFIMYILFLTPVFFINNLYTLRSTLYAYVCLMFFTIIIFDYLEKKTLTKNKLALLLFLTFLMVAWRSEGIVFLVFNIISLILVYPKLRSIKKVAIILILIIVLNTAYSRLGTDEMYTASVTVLPLSIMLNQDLKGETLEQDIENINKVFNVERIKAFPNYHFMESYWDGMIQQFKAYENINKDFYKSFVNIVLNNLGKFLDVRLKVFYYTFENIEYPNNCYRAYLTNWVMPDLPTRIVGMNVEKFNFRAFDIQFKINVESFLMENKFIKIVFWNIIPLIICISLLAILVIKLIKKQWIFVVAILGLFGKVSITFLTSTASYFIYYFTEYVVGMFLVCIVLFKLMDGCKKRRKDG